MRKNNQARLKSQGFTLLEILIALFIFSFLSMLLMNSLRNVIDSLSGTESKAERLRKIQMALLIMSRDIEQTVNRTVTNNAGKEDSAFVGTKQGFTFTHAGLANATNRLARSSLQRAAYFWSDKALQRSIWMVLDQPPKSQPHSRVLLSDISEAHFEYLGKNGRFYNEWPLNGQGSQGEEELPRGIRIYLTFSHWGTMTQLYLIPAEGSKASQQQGSLESMSSNGTPSGTSPDKSTQAESKPDVKPS
jgi:general secretion pathway protein J